MSGTFTNLRPDRTTCEDHTQRPNHKSRPITGGGADKKTGELSYYIARRRRLWHSILSHTFLKPRTWSACADGRYEWGERAPAAGRQLWAHQSRARSPPWRPHAWVPKSLGSTLRCLSIISLGDSAEISVQRLSYWESFINAIFDSKFCRFFPQQNGPGILCDNYPKFFFLNKKHNIHK